MSAQGIEFMPQGSLLKDAVAKAKAEGKMVFLDCYTSWCGPCRTMANKVFPTQEVGDFMNPKFVSIKIDMEKGEGPSLVEKLQVSAYPTFIIFNAEGNEVGRFLGGSDAAGFMERVTKNSVDNGSAAMDARFAAGERDE
ncbi:MAG: thioredoxin family protein, partial [Duncaniella sp.]|nr:thioredoxin family protein [Duncaniella sp.]